MVDIGLYISYGLLAIATAVSIIFPLIYSAQNPKESIKSFIGIAALLVLLALCYVFASDTISFSGVEELQLSSGQIKWSGAGLIMFYLLAIGAVITAVVSEIVSAFK